MNLSDCFILDLGRTKDILVFMPKGARRVEKYKASQAALEIKNEDHAGHGNVEIIGSISAQMLILVLTLVMRYILGMASNLLMTLILRCKLFNLRCTVPQDISD